MMSIFTLGASAIRGGETPDKNYLCFTANKAGSTVELKKLDTFEGIHIEYSTDGDMWIPVDFSSATTTTTGVITLNDAGDKVYFRNTFEGVAKVFSTDPSCAYKFIMTGSIAASGNVMSLIDKSCKAKEIPCGDCFRNLFQDCTALTSAPSLPATTLAGSCYEYMFDGCTNLTSAPELPATTLATSCYSSMFSGCTALKSAPKLPATTLANKCYSSMFNGCTSLTSAPELPATTLANYCYTNMFSGCTGLTSAPKLPATTLANNCYSAMFTGCTNLNYISVAFTTWVNTYTMKWLFNVSPTGIFICPEELPKTYSVFQIPSGWTVNGYDLTVSSVGWASMYLPITVTIPEGIEVYYASAASENTITLTKIEDKIPANTGVIVKASEGKVTFTYDNSNPTLSGTNLFEGTSGNKAFNAEKDGAVYVLSGVNEDNGNPQFQNYTGTTLGAHKIWLPASAVGGSNAKELRFVFENEETGIHSINVNDSSTGSETGENMYNLNGVRVNDGYKGIVIVNGKKVIKK